MIGNRSRGPQVHRSTYRALTPDELVNPDEIKACDEFDTATKEKLGPEASTKDFDIEPEIVTQNLDWYDDDEEHKNHIPEVDYIKPEKWKIISGMWR